MDLSQLSLGKLIREKPRESACVQWDSAIGEILVNFTTTLNIERDNFKVPRPFPPSPSMASLFLLLIYKQKRKHVSSPVHLRLVKNSSLSPEFVCFPFPGNSKEGSVIRTLIGISPPKDPGRGV